MRPALMAGFAGLFLLLGVCVFLLPTARGLEVKLAQKTRLCGDGDRSVVIHVGAGGKLSLNGKALEPEELEPLLQSHFGRTAERRAFISAEPEVPFAQVARVIDSAKGQVDMVALLTPEVQRAYGECLTVAGPPPEYDPGLAPPTGRVKEVPWWRVWR